MQRIHQVSARKGKDSKVVFLRVKVILEQKLEEITGCTNTILLKNDEQIKILLNNSISFKDITDILTTFWQHKIKVEKVVWKNKSKGPFKRGHLEIIIS